jgi:uncharacterized cofD-like protein
VSIPIWLAPGSTIKRWLAVFAGGLLIVALGIDYMLHDLYLTVRLPGWVYYATVQFVPRTMRGILFMSCGLLAITASLFHLNGAIVAALTYPLRQGSAFPLGQGRGSRSTVIDAVAQHRTRQRGPRVVAIGGGTGMSRLLHGLRDLSCDLSVVVTVADDGGSSGRLRRELSILPPGDFRQCIAALADVEPLMAQLLQYRFPRGAGLEGHSFGNLFIAAMADITGSFEAALAASSRVLAVRGRILPSTLQDITLAAQLRDSSTIEGESVLAHGRSPIERVFLIPDSPVANPEAVSAIRAADIIAIGPGSLYTSILPNLLVPGIVDAIRDSRASVKALVCNVATEPGETDSFTACAFVNALQRHVGGALVQQVIANDNFTAAKPAGWKSEVVVPGDVASLEGDVQFIECDVVDDCNGIRHDPQKLAQVLLWLYDGKRRPLYRDPTALHLAG